MVCYCSHKKKRMREIKKLISRGLYDKDGENPFDLFVSSTEIRWCYYKESKSILGQTYGMLVLQDFESITANLLCRTIETVEGGGIITILLKNMTSLKQFYSMVMVQIHHFHYSQDCHAKYRTESHNDIVPRFNERFILSLSNCQTCMVLDVGSLNCLQIQDELNILPINKKTLSIELVKASITDEDAEETPSQKALATYLQSVNNQLDEKTKNESPKSPAIANSQVLRNLTRECKTVDQATAVYSMLDIITQKTLQTTVSLTASRGRVEMNHFNKLQGKSASLGLTMAGAIGFGYSSIFVTAPSPENLQTAFEFCIKGLKALKYMVTMKRDLNDRTIQTMK